VIHLEGFGLIILGKTCRLCLRCDTVVAHKAELDKFLSRVVTVSKPEYFVLGTADRPTYRRGLAGGASLDDVMAHMSDFKSYWNVEITPAGWYPKNERGTGSAGSQMEPTRRLSCAIMSLRRAAHLER
jgi:hypothetical protein